MSSLLLCCLSRGKIRFFTRSRSRKLFKHIFETGVEDIVLESSSDPELTTPVKPSGPCGKPKLSRIDGMDKLCL